MAKPKVWVLTFETNDYDQRGAYFLAVFGKKPTYEQLADTLKGGSDFPADIMGAIAFLERLLKGGGRQGDEHTWYNLEEVELR